MNRLLENLESNFTRVQPFTELVELGYSETIEFINTAAMECVKNIKENF